MDSPKTILVIIVARIGDTLLSTPAIRALKEEFPNAKITVLSHPKRKCLLENLPFIDQLAAITKHRALFQGRLPGSQNFDIGLVYGSDKALIDYAQRVCRNVVAFENDAICQNRKLRLIKLTKGKSQHAVTERLALATAVGASTKDKRLNYVVSPAENNAAIILLKKIFPEKPHPLIGLQICSFPTKSHRDWPLENFSALISRISVKYPQAFFLILGDELTRTKSLPILQEHISRVRSVAGKTDLRESAAIISLLDLYIGVDTGPTHIAGALGGKMVALYHAAYPGSNLAPLDNPLCHIIEHPLTGKNTAQTAKMADISIDDVFHQADQLLQDTVQYHSNV